MFDDFDFDFEDFFDRFMEGFIKVLIIGLILCLVLLVFVGIYGLFYDIAENDFMKITYNDGHIITYRNPSNTNQGDSYMEFKSEGKKYTIFYKDIKAVERYDEDIAKGVYK